MALREVHDLGSSASGDAGNAGLADFDELEAAGRSVKDRTAYDVIYDMSEVESAHLATDFISKRGRLPQANPNRQRLYVVPQEDLKLLVRLYAAYRASAGGRARSGR